MIGVEKRKEMVDVLVKENLHEEKRVHRRLFTMSNDSQTRPDR